MAYTIYISMSRLKTNESKIAGTSNDNNNKFDINKLIALDRNELNKLNDLYGEYRRFHGPKFTPEVWNKCLEEIVSKLRYFDKKYEKKPFGWINIVIYHQFIKELKFPETEIVKHKPVDKLEDMFQTNDNESIAFIELSDIDVIDSCFPSERNLTPSEKLEHLVNIHCTKKEKLAYELLVKGALITDEERIHIRNIKQKIRKIIYSNEELAEMKKKKAFRQIDRKSIKGREKFIEWAQERAAHTEEERKEIRIKRRNEKRIKMLEELKKSDPKKYKEKLKQIERYEKNAKEKPTYAIEKQKEFREKKKKLKESIRKDILNNNKQIK